MTTAATAVKYMNKSIMHYINGKAIKNVLPIEQIVALPDDVNFPIRTHELDEDVNIKAEVVINAEGKTVWMDITFKDWDDLPTKEI